MTGRHFADIPAMPISQAYVPVRAAGGRRPVYGRVYELFTDDPRDGEHPYVGQTTQTIAERKRGHKSARDVARDPWKARIIDGPRGHRLLETVYASGDARADQLMLDQVEAFWIDRLKPTHNDQRPVRPMPGVVLPARPKDARPARRPAKRRERRPLPWRVLLLLLVTGPCMALLAGVAGHGQPVDSPAPFVAAAVGAALGCWVTFGLLRLGRKLGIR